jgi:CxxC motif-containing protein (DUF1111 family)
MAARRLTHFDARLGLAAAAVVLPVVAAAGSLDAAIGERLFRRAWTPATGSTASSGLGPRFNARACVTCHEGLARASARRPDALDRGAVVRFDAAGAHDLGRQWQPQTIAGLPAEATVTLAWRPAGQGLEMPSVAVATASGAPTPAASLRVAPSLRLAGAIEAADPAAILAAADPDDRDGDGVRGRPHLGPGGAVGRFGWKAGSSNLDEAVSLAFALDLGLSTPRRPDAAGDCVDAACRAAAPTGARPELDGTIVAAVAGFLAGERPAPDAHPAADPAGEALFAATGCATCHRPTLAARDGGAVALYSDLLLHDLGPGLDDGVAEGGARAGEWRTAPLAGLGAAEPRGLLHDGRARSIDEAVAWHDGEARRAAASYRRLGAAERAILIAYLRAR